MRTLRRNGFTLIELLVVIGIIALLAAILIPVIQTVFTNAEKFKAKSEAHEVRKAIEAYYNTYQRLPVAEARQGTDKADVVLSDTDFKILIKVLTAVPKDTDADDLNPRKIIFLDVQTVTKDGTMKDPWDQLYKVKLDLTLDGRVEFPEGTDKKDISTRAVVYSLGPNQTNDIGKTLTDPDNDDISTVKK
jgi:prepilin-type N-terminal cleavage/methylation domain-containing protein